MKKTTYHSPKMASCIYRLLMSGCGYMRVDVISARDYTVCDSLFLSIFWFYITFANHVCAYPIVSNSGYCPGNKYSTLYKFV